MSRPKSPSETTDSEPLTATIERYEGDIDVCTIHPIEPNDDERLTAWISAETGSFLSVRELR
ncbi:DUF7511 domain-containing protein [Halorubrum trueperi]|uniref:DUF7511 domain-containing protein n=1 Tax=Halorubrum trueperi TaxID=2004704 RepID=A0ABD5UIW2_9EURY